MIIFNSYICLAGSTVIIGIGKLDSGSSYSFSGAPKVVCQPLYLFSSVRRGRVLTASSASLSLPITYHSMQISKEL